MLLATASLPMLPIHSAQGIEARGIETQGANIEVVLEGMRNQKGKIHLSLYNHEDDFPRADTIYQGLAVAVGEPALFTDVPPGQYAVAVYHDENNNEEFDRGLLGIPLEGYGFSRDARAVLNAPDFSSAVFDVGTEDITLTIALNYWSRPRKDFTPLFQP